VILELMWDFVALAGMLRGLHLLREAIVDKRALGNVGNGRETIARGQIEHAWMGVCIYFFLLCPGLIALVYKLGATSLEHRLNLVPFFLVAALFTLAIRQERDAYYRRKLLGQPPPYTVLHRLVGRVARGFDRGKRGE
jgi:hypothetical protein